MLQLSKLVDPNKVAVYVRWSTEEQGQGHTLEVQRDTCRQVMSMRGWVWNESLVYVEAGLTGTNLDRPELSRLREEIKLGMVDCVITYNLSRLSRHVADAVNLVLDEWDGICHWASATEGISTIDGSAKIILPILASMAQLERDRIVSNTRDGLYATARKGNYTGGPVPFGFEVNPETKKIKTNPEQAVIVKRIVDEFLSGSGMQTIAWGLNKDGIPSPGGKRWGARTIRRLLDNVKLVGTLVFGATVVNPRRRRNKTEKPYLPGTDPVVVENVVEDPLLSVEEWLAVRKLREQRAAKSSGARTFSSDYVLSGITRCAKCGATVAGASSGGSAASWYCCMGKRFKNTECDHKNHRKDELESAILSAVRANLGTGNHLNLLQTTMSRYAAKITELKQRIATWQQKVESIKPLIAKWMAEFERNVIDNVTVNERVKELKAQQEQAELHRLRSLRELRDLEKRSPEESVAKLQAAALQLSDWDDLKSDQRKQLLRTLIKRVQVYQSPNGERTLEIEFVTDEEVPELGDQQIIS